MPLIFGEVLFDCFSDGQEVLGGAPFNVAWNLKAFGMSPLLVSRVGDDILGRRIRNKMGTWDMTTSGLQLDSSYPTGKVDIDLIGGEPRFTILPDQAYDYILPFIPDLKNKPPFIYHGSLALRNYVSRNTLSTLKQEYQCPVFVDVNLRSPWWNAERVHRLAADAAWLKLNQIEMDSLFPGGGSLKERCRQLLKRFNLEAVFVTLGEKGAVALDSDNNLISSKPQESIAIVDTVGAGDAFSSVLLLGIMHNWPLSTSLQRSQEFASAVVGQRGAITHDRNFYKTFNDRWNVR